MSKKIYITKSDYEKLTKMLKDGINNDLKNQKYITDLISELEKCEIINQKEALKDIVTINSKVSFKFLDSDKEMSYLIVLPQDADVKAGKISVLSPIGTALIGYSAGDILEWDLPSGVKKIKIQKVDHF